MSSLLRNNVNESEKKSKEVQRNLKTVEAVAGSVDFIYFI